MTPETYLAKVQQLALATSAMRTMVPQCALCCCRCDSIRILRIDSGAVHIEAHCHGSIERRTYTADQINNDRWKPTPAFQDEARYA
jgi:hypothetical protein